MTSWPLASAVAAIIRSSTANLFPAAESATSIARKDPGRGLVKGQNREGLEGVLDIRLAGRPLLGGGAVDAVQKLEDGHRGDEKVAILRARRR
jgi:hypothetical protein